MRCRHNGNFPIRRKHAIVDAAAPWDKQADRDTQGKKMPRSERTRAIVAPHPRSGFTFVELLIVVAIVSILAAIALPSYRDYEMRAEAAEALLFLGDTKIAVNEFYSRWGRMPADNGEAGLRSPDAFERQVCAQRRRQRRCHGRVDGTAKRVERASGRAHAYVPTLARH